MEIIPYAKIVRFVAIVLITMIIFFPHWLPFNVGIYYGPHLMAALFLLIIISFISINRTNKISEKYLASIKKTMKPKDFVRHLKELEELIITELKSPAINLGKKQAAEIRLKIVRYELTKFKQTTN